MSTEIFIDVVCVTYNCNCNQELINRIKSLFYFSGMSLGKVIIVDTSKDLDSGSVVFSHETINNFFEFTGYHFGLKSLLLNISNANNERNKVLFMNDTVFSSHFHSYFLVQLISFRGFILKSMKSSYIIGHSQQKTHGKIIPTCFFCVVATSSELLELKFFPDSFVVKNKLLPRQDLIYDELYVGDKSDFDQRVESWLRPIKFYKGWYKASIFCLLNDDEFNRKKLSIYLEHSFLKHNKNLVFIDVDSGFVNFFRNLDLCYQNFLKLKKRFVDYWLFIRNN